ncbi:MAG: sodium:calcium antiporter [Pseudomonadota bacterium]
MTAFAGLGLGANVVIFMAMAAVVWMAGVRITRYANVISIRTGIGQAVVGMLLLGGVTSLPELAVTASAAAQGSGGLAVNSLLGAVAMQVVILAMADFAVRGRALTAVVPNPLVLLQGAFVILLLCVVVSATVVGDVAFLRVGLWMWLLLFVGVFALRTLARAGDRQPWRASDHAELEDQERRRAEAAAEGDASTDLRSSLVGAAVAGTLIVAAGSVLSLTGDAIASQTGLGGNFVGLVLLAFATALPEISTVMTAARAGLYTLAVSDIFGTNLFDVLLLVMVDAISGREPVLNDVGSFSTFAAVLGMAVVVMFVAGVAERRDRTFLRMGIDSVGVFATYAGGLVILFFLR